jgi:hypothetical protein
MGVVAACLVAVSVLSTQARAEAPPPKTPAESFAEQYEQFPEIPTGTLIGNPFYEGLRALCETAPTIPASKCGAGKQPLPALPTNAPPDAWSARIKNHDACEAQTDLARMTAWSASLVEACKNLKSGDVNAVTAADVAALREARDNAAALSLLYEWNSAQDNKLAGPAAALVPGVGALSDALIRGMSEFLVKRAKEEALRYLRETFVESLCRPGLSVFYSNTCAALTSLDSSQALDAIGAYLRAAAERDLRALPEVVLAYVGFRKRELEGLTFTARLGISMFEAGRDGRTPVTLLRDAGLLDGQACEAAGKPCEAAAKVVRLLSALAYGASQISNDWSGTLNSIGSKSDGAIVGAAVVLLAEARLQQIPKSFPGKPRATYFADPATGFTLAQIQKALLSPMLLWGSVHEIEFTWVKATKDISALVEDSRRERVLAGIVGGAERISRGLEQASALFGDAADQAAIAKAAKALRTSASFAVEVARREYGKAALGLLKEASTLLADTDPKKTLTLPPMVVRYVPLLVELGTAASSTEVAATLDAYAAPISTYKEKYARGMVALNGMVGAHYSGERIDSDGVHGTSGAFGAFMPIGIHATHPFGAKWVHFGLLLSVLDLGALASFRTSSEIEGELDGETPAEGDAPEVKKAPEIGFQQVLSPGAFVTLGIAKSPAIVGFGVSMTPELREVQQDELKTQVSVLRYGGFLAVDIPIFPFNR